MKTKILAGCMAIALFGLQSAHAQSSCADDIAVVEADLSKKEAFKASPKSPKAKDLIAARRLLEEAKEAQDQGKEKRCQKKLAAAKRKLPK